MENTPPPQKQPDSPLAIAAMVLGVISLTGPGLILGIPAIILAIIALKKKKGGRGLSITGLVTGIISTVLSLIFIALLVWLAVWAASNPEQFKEPSNDFQQNEQLFDSSQT